MARCLRYRHLVLALGFTMFSATAARAASLTLAWDPSVEAAGYVVYYGNQSGVYTASMNVGKQTTVEVPNLAAGAP